MGELTRLRLPSSRPPAPAPAPPEEDDDLLSEILLRLPPLPSSLPRASLVCSRWRGLVSAPAFLRRFRAHHRRRRGGPPPPLLGFFEDALHGVSFTATLDAPDRVPDGRFSLRFDDGSSAPTVLGCRDGLVLVLDPAYPLGQLGILVWDPVTGDQRRLAVPPALDDGYKEIHNGAVLRAAAGLHGDHHFQFRLVMVGVDRKHGRAFACVYSSEASVWGGLISAPLVSMSYHTVVSMSISSTLIGNSLYWSVFGNPAYGILEFDLDTERLAVIPVPVSSSSSANWSFWAMPMEDGSLGFLYLLDFSTQLWKRKTDRDGDVSWVLAKTIELDKLLSLDKEKSCPMMLGFSDGNNVVFLWTVTGGIVMVQFESMQFKKLAHTRVDFSLVHPHVVHPFATVYTADMGTGVGDDRAELPSAQCIR